LQKNSLFGDMQNDNTIALKFCIYSFVVIQLHAQAEAHTAPVALLSLSTMESLHVQLRERKCKIHSWTH